MTTIVSVRRNGHVVIAGDGQATLGNTVMKGNVKKVRRLYNDKVIAGFAGVLRMHSRCSSCLNVNWKCIRGTWSKPPLNWRKTGVPTVCYANWKRCWPSRMKPPRSSSRVTAMSCNLKNDLIAIGSGGPYAQAAARALLENTELGAREIAEKALDIAGDICIYTNHFHTIEELTAKA